MTDDAVSDAKSKRAVLLRVALTPLVSAPALVVAGAFVGAGSPVGLILAVPALCLGWIWCVDLYDLMAGLVAPRRLKKRPSYVWLAVACVVPFVAFWCWNLWS